MTSREIAEALERIFAADSELYQARGFQRRVGFGERPALVNIDLANAWTRPGNPFTCDGMDVIIPGVQRLLTAGRAKGIPIAFTTTAYAVTDGPNTDMGIWHHKIPVEVLRLGTEAVAIDERVAPEPGEHVIVKKRASGFHGTYLAGFLRAHGVDTVILTGVTMAGCVRHTCEDAIAEGFRPIVVRECVGDRVAGAVEWNLFDIDAKFGDVEPLERVLEYLEGIAHFSESRGVLGAAGTGSG
jgi:N-carbamoylsarcosine amidase